MNTTKNKIIIAPLNWGLGHATRCIPIIKALIKTNLVPIIASDGAALWYLKKEFPTLQFLELPAYNITYSKNLKLNLLLKAPRILRTIQQENKEITNYVNQDKNVIGIISDNRFGVRSKKVPSVYITHQINVLSGFTTYFSSKIHQNITKKYNQCWVPDNNSEFSGKLSISKKIKHQKFIGVLSRFQKEEVPKTIDILVLISGAEPNRTYFEDKLKEIFKNDTRTIVFVLGKVAAVQKKWKQHHNTFYNFMLSSQLQKTINASKIVVCRSGYSSIMDLAVLHKKVFFIPTKNQPEQEYLAKYLQNNKIAPSCNLADFTLEKLAKITEYKGLKTETNLFNTDLFGLFHSK
ncbi:glycosyltransferase [uncultured Polaribacter sp.]|uniref:glycosyltransferase n=1 Tax=uncultured Polaribacter sp. TaxID=174711 RepID=UPI00262140CA|nr:glycosyltransferase [uncultured Polaribacter sp.]